MLTITYIKRKIIFIKPNIPNKGYKNFTKLAKPKRDVKIEMLQSKKFIKVLFLKLILSKKQRPEDIAVVNIATNITILYKISQNLLIVEERYNKGNSKSE